MIDRIKESDLVLPTLRILSEQPDGFLSTSKLIQELEEVFSPSGTDAALLDGRSDTYFSQKVRNLISHRDQASSFIYKGFAEYLQDREGLKITSSGRSLLAQIAD